MQKTFFFLLAVLLTAGCAPMTQSSKVARAFICVPDHYVGNITKADRKFFVRETLREGEGREPSHNYEGRNLNFSWDGEEPMSGEAPLTFHLFDSSHSHPTVGVFIERFYNARRRPSPPTSLYILSYIDSRWVDVTDHVLPQPFDPRLCYEFSRSSDALTVRLYTNSKHDFMTPGPVLSIWRWTGSTFTPTRP